jgi:hypothetical protein
MISYSRIENDPERVFSVMAADAGEG